MKTFFATLTLAGLLLTIGFALHPFSSQNSVVPIVNAQELVSDMAAQIRALSSEQVSALQEKLGVDNLPNFIAEAQTASDLKAFTLDQTLTGTDGNLYHYALVTDGTAYAAKDGIDLQDFQPVTYTNSKGGRVIMVVGQDLLPSLVLSYDGSDTFGDRNEISGTFYVTATSDATGTVMIGLDPKMSLEEKEAFIAQEVAAVLAPDPAPSSDMQATAAFSTDENGNTTYSEDGGMSGGGTESTPVQQ